MSNIFPLHWLVRYACRIKEDEEEPQTLWRRNWSLFVVISSNTSTRTSKRRPERRFDVPVQVTGDMKKFTFMCPDLRGTPTAARLYDMIRQRSSAELLKAPQQHRRCASPPNGPRMIPEPLSLWTMIDISSHPSYHTVASIPPCSRPLAECSKVYGWRVRRYAGAYRWLSRRIFGVPNLQVRQ